MSPKQVVIVSALGLFRDGLKRILESAVDVTSVASLDAARSIIRNRWVDAVVIDSVEFSDDLGSILTWFLDAPNVKIVFVGLDANTLQIYHHEEIVHASQQTLIETIVS